MWKITSQLCLSSWSLGPPDPGSLWWQDKHCTCCWLMIWVLMSNNYFRLCPNLSHKTDAVHHLTVISRRENNCFVFNIYEDRSQLKIIKLEVQCFTVIIRQYQILKKGWSKQNYYLPTYKIVKLHNHHCQRHDHFWNQNFATTTTHQILHTGIILFFEHTFFTKLESQSKKLRYQDLSPLLCLVSRSKLKYFWTKRISWLKFGHNWCH